jgi:hypothetical protein
MGCSRCAARGVAGGDALCAKRARVSANSIVPRARHAQEDAAGHRELVASVCGCVRLVTQGCAEGGDSAPPSHERV